jgi:NAD-dependent histone deacetylase SIR2
MGNEASTEVDESTAPLVLEARNIEALVKYVKQHNVNKVVVMVCTMNPHTVHKS